MNTTPNTPTPSQNTATVAQQVADAHRQLTLLRKQLGQHPELDEAISKLELALSALTLQTGGLL
jgi:hypothetical protein